MKGHNSDLPEDLDHIRARPSTPIQNEVDETESPSSSFELPYHILKNMTPVKNRRGSDSDSDRTPEGSPTKDSVHQMRKQQQLNCRTFKLRQKQQTITERINELKQKRQLLIAASSQKLTESLNSAHRRRESFIQDVKNKAKLSIERQEKMSNLMFKCDLSIEIGATDHLGPSLGPSIGQERMWYDDKKIKVIQRAVRAKLLAKRVREFQQSRPFEKLLNYSYRKVLLHLKEKSEFSLLINQLLTSLNLPDLSSCQNYKSFQLSFVIISDMKDSVRFNHHSGVNSNVSKNPLDNLLSNALPLLTFKMSQILIRTFTRFLNESSLHDIITPFSMERLKLAKVWRYYHFVFDCFKSNHLKNCLVINESAIDIVNRQLDIVDLLSVESGLDEDIQGLHHQRKFLLNSRVNLNTTIVPEVTKDWTNIGMTSSEFIQSIQDITELVNNIPSFPQVRADMSALNEATKSNRRSNQSFKKFEIGLNSLDSMCFIIPPGISVFDWRKYWMDKLMKDKLGSSVLHHGETQHSELYGIPRKMSTGRISPMLDYQFEDNEDYEKLGILKVYEKYENLHRIETFPELLHQVAANANYVFLNIYDFIKNNTEFPSLLFEDNDDCLQDIMNDFESIKTILDDYEESDNYATALKYFRLHLSNMRTLLSVGGFERFKVISRIEILMEELSQPDENADVSYYRNHIIDHIAKVYWDLEIIIFIKWVNLCKLPSIRYMKFFENIYKFVSSKSHRIEMGTNSPHLRFPKFYKFLEDNYDAGFSFNYLTMVRASLEVPTLSKNGPRLLASKRAFLFYKKVFINYIFSERKQSIKHNDFIELYEADFASIGDKLSRILLTSTIMNILVNCNNKPGKPNYHQIGEFVYTNLKEWPPNALVAKVINEIYGDNTDQNWLQVYLTRQIGSTQSTNGIKLVLAKKFKQIFNEESNSAAFLSNRRSIITSNFQFIIKHAVNLTNEINCLVELIYEVYNPLLNWIYRDIGEP